jgi:hypothetical protein
MRVVSYYSKETEKIGRPKLAYRDEVNDKFTQENGFYAFKLISNFSKYKSAMANPNRSEGHIFDESSVWGPKYGLPLKDLVNFSPKCDISKIIEGPRVGHGWYK